MIPVLLLFKPCWQVEDTDFHLSAFSHYFPHINSSKFWDSLFVGWPKISQSIYFRSCQTWIWWAQLFPTNHYESNPQVISFTCWKVYLNTWTSYNVQNGTTEQPADRLCDDRTASHPICLLGTLDVRLMGCQDLLENVPGRSKAASVPLPGWSPSETRSSFISRANRNRGVSSRNVAKSEELSSKLAWPCTREKNSHTFNCT